MITIVAIVIALFVGAFFQARGWRCQLPDRRLGLLGDGSRPMDGAVRRSARLAELGEAGTYRTFNCGEILHVDYEHGFADGKAGARFAAVGPPEYERGYDEGVRARFLNDPMPDPRVTDPPLYERSILTCARDERFYR